MFSPETMFEMSQDSVTIKVPHNFTEDYVFHNLTGYRSEGHRSVIGRASGIPFLEDCRDTSSSPIPRNQASLPGLPEDGLQNRSYLLSCLFQNPSRNIVRSSCLPSIETLKELPYAIAAEGNPRHVRKGAGWKLWDTGKVFFSENRLVLFVQDVALLPAAGCFLSEIIPEH